MLSVFLRHACRALLRDKVYTSVSIVGLGVGMAVTLLVSLWIYEEYTFDSFHKNANRIYRVTQSERSANGIVEHRAVTGTPLAVALREDVAGIEATVRFYRIPGLVRNGQTALPEQTVYFADSTIFSVFTFPLASGDAQQALARPMTVVLSRDCAQRLFGDGDPMGKTITFNEEYTFEVTGVLEEIPRNSHLRFDYLASYESVLKIYPGLATHWDASGWTYVLFDEHHDAKSTESQLPGLVAKHRGEEIAAVITLSLQSLSSIHLGSFLGGEIEPKTDPESLYIFMAAAALVLLLAILNHNNLTTARAASRMREIAVRRVLGSNRFQLFIQWTWESMLVVSVSSLVALGIAELARPHFASIVGVTMPASLVGSGMTWVVLGCVAILTMVVTSIYPAHYALTFKTATLLQYDRATTTLRSWMRRSLVVIQFAAGIALVLCAAIAYRQLTFMEYSDLGFDPADVIVVPLHGEQMAHRFPVLKEELLRVPGVEGVTASSHLPGGDDCYGLWFEQPESGESQMLQYFDVDGSFASCMNLEIVEADSSLIPASPKEVKSCFVSESAASRFNPPLTVGAPLTMVQRMGEQSVRFGEVRVAGIVKDFHARNLFYLQHPMVLVFNPEFCSYALVRLDDNNLPAALSNLSNAWSAIEPDRPFVFSFLRDDLRALYSSQAQFAELLGYASLIAVVLACVGLLSLGSFMLARRTREVGIRKVLGATTAMVARLLFGEMLRLVVIANVIAWPVAYWLMSRWLQNYIYRTTAHPSFFLIVGIASLALAQLVVSYHTLRAAHRNPVEALRYE